MTDYAKCTCSKAAPPFDAVFSLDCPFHGGQAASLVKEAIDRDRLIYAQPSGTCELCGAIKETRPYGPNGENVCFACGMKDKPAMERAMERRFGD